MKSYPVCRLSGQANVLIMQGLQSANLSAKLLRELSDGAVIGPVHVGMEKPVQVATMASPASDLVTLAVLEAGGITGKRKAGTSPLRKRGGEPTARCCRHEVRT